MKEVVRVITLRKTRYSDRHSVLSAFSRERGRISLLVPEGTGAKVAAVKALTMSLSVVECEVDISPGRDIFPASRMMAVSALPSIHTHPVKQLVTMFLAETIGGLLRDSTADESLFDYIVESLKAFDAMTDPVSIANFHLWMIYGMGRMAGIEPDIASWKEGCWFDFNDGVFRMTKPLAGRSLDPDEAAALGRISRMTADNISAFRFTRQERNRAIDLMIEYLSVHYSPVGASSLTTLGILREVLG